MSDTLDDRNRFYIGGEWLAPTGTGTIDVADAATEEVMGRVPEGLPADAARAVAAARAAFEGWAATPVAERAACLRRLQDGLLACTTEVATLIAREVGTPLAMATVIQAALPAAILGSYVDIATDFSFSEPCASSIVVREPVGVVAAVTPWNYPLYQLVCKVAPALAAGCTVVAKPSEVAPLSAFLLADLVDRAGLPPGVFNLVTGYGSVVGEALVGDPDVDMVSFTGSTAAGRRVSELAATTLKRVTLELGGKSPSLVLDDADFDEAVRATVSQCYLNSGQTCIAWTRLLVPRQRHDEVVDLARRVAEEFTVGDPLAGEARLGPLSTKTHQQRVQGWIRRGVEEGATLVTGGAEQPEGLASGFYVRPTVFADVTADMAIAQEEIFGPVLCIMAYDDIDEAVAIANDTIYGLHGAVFSGDRDRGVAVARRLRTGQVDVCGGGYNPVAPFGGYKQSGVGRELGRYGLEEYLEVKSLQL
ncbi:MAG TPA: aldehyde dehydrogenase family protein [Acidimicrobiales bacterium]|nr:aldehyde dehydrogenase family protein [Acidimicrobiales bacterium]